MQDCIEKEIVIHAPVSRVWLALTDHRQFGEWFRVKLEGPFVAGQQARGHITHPGYEHLLMTVMVQRMDAEREFVFTWHPYAIEPETDYSSEKPTVVTFTLQAVAEGTHLRVTECGFNDLPEARRDLAFRMNDGGWSQQITNIATYVADHA